MTNYLKPSSGLDIQRTKTPNHKYLWGEEESTALVFLFCRNVCSDRFIDRLRFSTRGGAGAGGGGREEESGLRSLCFFASVSRSAALMIALACMQHDTSRW
ncbi:hypothetical protein BHM03_00033330 [Ensete ventricosum]|nr:hypothetical protein BHM03_00033330 [Ensete ventricosum]